MTDQLRTDPTSPRSAPDVVDPLVSDSSVNNRVFAIEPDGAVRCECYAIGTKSHLLLISDKPRRRTVARWHCGGGGRALAANSLGARPFLWRFSEDCND